MTAHFMLNDRTVCIEHYVLDLTLSLYLCDRPSGDEVTGVLRYVTAPISIKKASLCYRSQVLERRICFTSEIIS
jgi:hypothetical protein